VDASNDEQEVVPSQDWRLQKRQLKGELHRLRRDLHAAVDPAARATAAEAVSAKEQEIVAHLRPWRGLPRDTVVGCRVDAEDLAAIDTLVEAGIRATRSEAAAWFIHEGIAARQKLLHDVAGTVAEIRRLRAEVQDRLHGQS
jgi:cell division protein FtsB